jgi:hypothetical protein
VLNEIQSAVVLETTTVFPLRRRNHKARGQLGTSVSMSYMEQQATHHLRHSIWQASS